MTEKTVLIVEDDPLLSELTRDILTSEGFTVVEAATLSKVTAALDTCAPQWLIVDFHLENWDGLSAIQAVRAAGGMGIKVIALSGWPLSDQRLAGFMNAANYCMPKPVDWDELLRIMRNEAAPPVAAI